MMKRAHHAVLRLFVFCLLGLPFSGYAQTKYQFDLPVQPLADSLRAVGQQTSTNVMFEPRLVKGLSAPALRIQTTLADALRRLLSGTELAALQTAADTILIQRAKVDAPTQATPLPEARETSGVQSAESSPTSAALEVEEVVVTAQKRLERLQDVPVPVTVLNTESLIERSKVRLQDFYTSVPGLNLTTGTGAQDAPILSIRGITTGGTGFGANPTVAIVVDDVPYGSSTSFGGGNLVPDLDPGDLARIEVLRGPQGTLYGASSLGGLVKYAMLDPTPAEMNGQVQAGLGSVHGGDGTGYGLRGSVNLPLGNALAMRASGFTRRDAGYIDDPALGVDGVNQRDSYGGRVSALWKASEAVSVKLSAVHQHSETDGSHLAHTLAGLGDLQQQYVLPGLGGYSRDSDVVSATLRAQLAGAELTSITGYAVNDVSSSIDRTAAFGGLMEQFVGVNGARFVEYFETQKVSQELRLSLPVGSRAEWRVGAFYTREDSDLVQDIEAVNAATGEYAGVPYHNPFTSTFREYALFSDVTFKLTERFDVQIGGRASRNEQTLSALFEGEFIPLFYGFPSGTGYPELDTRDTSHTYLLTPRLRISQDVMVYARLASGYRPGGPQPNATAVGSPLFFDPDTTSNIELGVKGAVLDRRVTLEASLFYIDWDDIQLQLTDPVTTFAYFGNAGGARSTGVELAGSVRSRSGTTVSSWVAWTDAELTENFPPGPSQGLSGDRLPFSSRFSGALSVDQEFALAGRSRGILGASLSYVGERLGTFTADGVRERFPSYTQADLHAGVRLDTWSLDLFINNIADKRGLLAGGRGTAQPFAYAYIQPRNYGISVTRRF